jgi:hypothetical protein
MIPNGATPNLFEGVAGYPVPNRNALLPDPGTGENYEGYRIRMTSMSVKAQVEGQDRLLSGRITIGFRNTQGVSGSGLDALYDLGSLELQKLQNQLSGAETYAVSASQKEFTATWKPMGVPSYFHEISGPGGVAPVGVTNQELVEEGTAPPCLVVAWRDAETSSSSILGPWVNLEVIQHWEVIPVNHTVHVVIPTPSRSDPTALAAALNMVTVVPNSFRSNRDSTTQGAPVKASRAWDIGTLSSMFASVPPNIRNNLANFAWSSAFRRLTPHANGVRRIEL